MKEDKCNRSTAKTKVIATINGKKYKSRTLMKLADEYTTSFNASSYVML